MDVCENKSWKVSVILGSWLLNLWDLLAAEHSGLLHNGEQRLIIFHKTADNLIDVVNVIRSDHVADGVAFFKTKVTFTSSHSQLQWQRSKTQAVHWYTSENYSVWVSVILRKSAEVHERTEYTTQRSLKTCLALASSFSFIHQLIKESFQL